MSASPVVTVGDKTILQRRCATCHVWKPAHPKYYSPTGKRTLDGHPVYHSSCRTCQRLKRSGGQRTERESMGAKEVRRARLRARQRAWVRLAQQQPERFQEIYREELEAEGYSEAVDLRAYANRKKGTGKWLRVRCSSRKSCGWSGSRRNIEKSLRLPCPHCGRKVQRGY